MRAISNAVQADKLARKIIPPLAGTNAARSNIARMIVRAEIQRQLTNSGHFNPRRAVARIIDDAVDGTPGVVTTGPVLELSKAAAYALIGYFHLDA